MAETNSRGIEISAIDYINIAVSLIALLVAFILRQYRPERRKPNLYKIILPRHEINVYKHRHTIWHERIPRFELSLLEKVTRVRNIN